MATSLSLPNFLSFFSPSNPPPKTPVPPPQLSFPTPQAQKYKSLLFSQESDGGHCGSLSTELSSVVCPSLAYSNTLFFKSAYNVQVIVEDNEPEERLLNRFRREVMRAGVIQECKRRRFHENKQEEKKRKTREAHKRNRRRRPQMRGPFQNKPEASPSKKNDDDEDNWEMPEGDASF
ncbi:PREDICTED: uncharacterized protein LOC105110550 [Populus euphratica]|uniref:Uncharacterized protein LOC105110550 n=1 Tax=Populus euphratica TaxID=75702 RepID=A0AAJ6X327_POPEU|nr:PREDICTED: uncharacterized protein LOC105110550 [Populus euphratica]